MENQEQVQPEVAEEQTKKNNRKLLVAAVKIALVAMSIFLLLSLAGVVLGAINFVGPAVQYPSWLLAIWLVVNLLLVAFILVHLALFAIAVGYTSSNEEAIYPVVTAAMVIFIGAWVLLANKHFAWVSIIAFGILIVCAIVDVVIALDVID